MGKKSKSAKKATPAIFVGWKMRKREGLELQRPLFSAPANYKDPEKISAYVAEKSAAWESGLGSQAYTGTFDSIVLADSANNKIGSWFYAGREPGSKKASVAAAARNWLLNLWGDHWSDNMFPADDKPPVVFYGFEPRLFLKLLGIECSLPSVAAPLPLSLWCGESAHRHSVDVFNLLVPREHAAMVDWRTVLAVRGVDVNGWAGPFGDAKLDSMVVAKLLHPLGIEISSDHCADGESQVS